MKLKIDSINFKYEGEKVLEDIIMEVEKNQFITILGHSGCGKSTLLNIISGTLKKDSGNIFVDNKKIEGVTEHFSYMPQEDLLLPWKNIYENVILYDRLHNNKKKDYSKLIDFFGLKGYEKLYPRHLSGGMKQRAAFLRTSICESDIWLLDEPFGALDIITRSQMKNWLLDIHRRIKKTIVLVTHDIEEAIYLSDKIYILGNVPTTVIKEIKISRENVDMMKLKEEIYNLLSREVE